MHVCLIHNPSAGEEDCRADELVGLATEAGHEVAHVEWTDDWQSRLPSHTDLIAVAGGDGTVAEVARATADRRIPLTILPSGTANNIARWLRLSGIPHDALIAGWARAFPQPLDLGVARGPWGTYRFLESVGTGLLAEMMAEIDEGDAKHVNRLERRDSRLRAAVDVLQKIAARADPVRCDLRLDGHDLAGDYLAVEVLNFGVAGPNLQLSPAADGGDGLLDVVLVETHERARLAQHLSTIGTGLQRAPAFRVHRARQVLMRCHHRRVHLDDELWTGEREGAWDAEITLERGALTFLVPPIAAPAADQARPGSASTVRSAAAIRALREPAGVQSRAAGQPRDFPIRPRDSTRPRPSGIDRHRFPPASAPIR